MSRFLGTEICMLDAKGRINVPSRMRKGLAPEANDSFVIVRSFDPCVNLYPSDEWDRFDAKLTALSDGDEDARDFVRGIYASAHEATLDSQGRLNIPDHLLAWAGLKKESMLVGIKDHLELWHPQAYEKRSSGIDQVRLANLAKRFLQ